MDNGLEQVEGGPTWTLSEQCQKELRDSHSGWRQCAEFFGEPPKNVRTPLEIVKVTIEGIPGVVETPCTATIVVEVREKFDEAVRFMAGLMGAY